MKYYKTKEQYDGYRILVKPETKHYCVYHGELVKGELFTEKELQRLFYPRDFPRHIFDEVEIPKNNTYKFFGVRFSFES